MEHKKSVVKDKIKAGTTVRLCRCITITKQKVKQISGQDFYVSKTSSLLTREELTEMKNKLIELGF